MSWALGQHSEWTKIRKLNPDLVIVSLGANDCCFQMYTLQKAEEGWLQRFLARLDRTPGQKVWAGPPKIGGQAHLPQAIDGLEFFVNLVRKYPITYLDAREVKVSMWGDLLHPDEKGRLDWAQWLFARLPAP